MYIPLKNHLKFQNAIDIFPSFSLPSCYSSTLIVKTEKNEYILRLLAKVGQWSQLSDAERGRCDVIFQLQRVPSGQSYSHTECPLTHKLQRCRVLHCCNTETTSVARQWRCGWVGCQGVHVEDGRQCSRV